MKHSCVRSNSNTAPPPPPSSPFSAQGFCRYDEIVTLMIRLSFMSLQSCPTLCVTLWTISCQAPLSMGFSMQEYWNGCHFLFQRIFQTQGSNPHLLSLLHWQMDSLPQASPGKPLWHKSKVIWGWIYQVSL